MKRPVLQQGKSYTFSDYFDLPNSTEEIVAEFGYQFKFAQLTLPRAALTHSLSHLEAVFYKRLPHISLTSEIARREAMIAPVLMELIDHLEVKLDIEYPFYVSEKLKGSLDYLIRSQQEFIVVEAKKSDMERGFSQLAVELIALDQGNDTASPALYGAITVGDFWRFGMLERQEKIIVKDIGAFRVPDDLEDLFKVLTGILQTPQTP
jgi:hypothetical protein